MITSADIVAAAREWVETPYRDKGRRKGKAVDCVGVPIRVANELGISDWDILTYSRHPRPSVLLAYADEHLVRIRRTRADLRLADVVVLYVRNYPMHLGIIADGDEPFSIIHASEEIRKCCEHRLDDDTRNRIYRVYRFPGVIDV